MKKIQFIAIMFVCMAVSQTMSAQTKGRSTTQRTTSRGTTFTAQRRQAPVQTPVKTKDWYIGGSLGLESDSYNGKTQSTTTTFSPEIGYKLDENWSIGLGIVYHSITYKGTKVDATDSRYAVSPYVRYNFLREGKVKLFGQGQLSFASYNPQGYVSSDEVVDQKTNQFSISVGPGISYDISDSFSLVCHFGSLAYTSSKRDVEGAKAFTTFGLDLINKVSFGFFVNF